MEAEGAEEQSRAATAIQSQLRGLQARRLVAEKAGTWNYTETAHLAPAHREQQTASPAPYLPAFQALEQPACVTVPARLTFYQQWLQDQEEARQQEKWKRRRKQETQWLEEQKKKEMEPEPANSDLEALLWQIASGNPNSRAEKKKKKDPEKDKSSLDDDEVFWGRLEKTKQQFEFEKDTSNFKPSPAPDHSARPRPRVS